MELITKSDFKGNIKISQNTKETNDLDLYIKRNQENFFRDLIGDFQYNEILKIDAIDSNKYKSLVYGIDAYDNQFFYFDHNEIYTSYFGIIESLKYLIYWDYVRNLNAKPTSVGIRFADAENSIGSSQLQTNNVIEQRYNLGIEIYQEACNFLYNTDDKKLHYFDITEIGVSGEYLMIIKQEDLKNSLNFCSLLNVGDSFELDEIDYIIDSNDVGDVPDQCSIIFKANSGLSFENKYIHINPYKDFKTKQKNLSVLDGMF